jgi:hypothetical protein
MVNKNYFFVNKTVLLQKGVQKSFKAKKITAKEF